MPFQGDPFSEGVALGIKRSPHLSVDSFEIGFSECKSLAFTLRIFITCARKGIGGVQYAHEHSSENSLFVAAT